MNLDKLISADDHVQETPDLWEKRLPAHLRDRGPKIVVLEDGACAWKWGHISRRLGMDVWAGREIRNEKDIETVPWAKVHPATYEPHARLKAMDDDGIYAAVLYPNFARAFVGLWKGFAAESDTELNVACLQAYNDFIADFAATDSRRLIPIGIIPLDSMEIAVAEIKRMAIKGIRGAMIPPEPAPGQFWNDPKFEPIWKAMAENNLVINLHTGPQFAGSLPAAMVNDTTGAPGSAHTTQTLLRYMCAIPVTTLLWSGIFDRYPDLKFVAVETDVGWLAYLRHRAEWVYKNSAKRWTVTPTLKHNPGYYFGRNLYATFQDDYAGIHGRDMIGVDALCWASDFPHPETTWPNTKESLIRQFEGVPEPELRKFVCENSARLYNIPV
jgi:predicted TIM-barrel fold metal-dependent hydrolase